MLNENLIHIGTSGWNYKHWKGVFYPEDSTQKEWFPFYLQHFDTVEINNTFYQLPSEKTLKNWKEKVPDDFIFSVKGSRYITHRKYLKDPKESSQKFFDRVQLISETLGVILFQLSPRWNLNFERLKNFIQILPAKFRYTFEFRNPTWFDEKVYNLLEENNIAFCIYDINGEMSPKKVTADIVYIRLHGPSEQAYHGRYDKQTLAGWVGAFRQWIDQGKEIYCYFDNDFQGLAPQNALELKEMITE
jgi:uncharacterized protein YecE (DUF72 family)